MKTFCRSLALSIGLLASMGSNAALLGLHGDGDTSPFLIPANNDYAPLVGLNGFIGGHLFNSSPGAVTVTYEYLFKEAGFTNKFLVDGVEVFNTSTSAYGETYSEVVGSLEDLGFSFLTGLNELVDNDRTSVDQNDGGSDHNFFLYFDDATGAVYAALDDSGAGPDDNHDDMIIRITAVPEPATLALLGIGLAATGVLRRRTQA